MHSQWMSKAHFIICQEEHDVQDASQLQLLAADLLATLLLAPSAHVCFTHLHVHNKLSFAQQKVIHQS